MRALFFDQKLHLRSVPKPSPQKEEALVRVLVAGICNTDLEITYGYMGFKGILGHEFVGVIEACADKKWLGKRVVGEINIGCGECPYCTHNMERHCPHRSVLGILNKDGVFAEYATLPIKNLHVVPDQIPDEQAVFTEPLAAALEIFEQVQFKPDEKVSIIGDGKLGILIAQVLKYSGCQLVCIGKHQNKLEILESMGIRTLLRDNVNLESQDAVVECSGSPDGFILALELLKPRGTLVLKSTYQQNFQFDLAKIVIDEIRIVGSRCGRFPPAIRFLKEGLIEVHPLITKIFPFEEALEAFRYSQQKGVLKVLLDLRTCNRSKDEPWVNLSSI